MTPQRIRELLEILDLIDESNPSPADVFVLKGVVRRIIQDLDYTREIADELRQKIWEVRNGGG